MDIVEAVKEGRGRFEWAEIESRYYGLCLTLSVFRDAMRFDDVPPMRWNRQEIVGDDRRFDGVRLPATAAEMQEIADLLTCWLPTPKILDLVWQNATLRFNPVVNLGPNKIVATQNIHDVHAAIERKIEKAGGYPASGIVASVGKYWVCSNRLVQPVTDTRKYGIHTACNYGWHSSDGAYPAVSSGLKVWQGEGTAHNDLHLDPSQVVRLVYRFARLQRPDGSIEVLDLATIAADPLLAPLINHGGVLKVTRQPSVPEPQPTLTDDGVIVLPTLNIYAMPSWHAPA